MEPLAVLREFASSGRLAQVSLQLSPQARTVRFGDQFEFAADAATRWRAKAGGGGANAPASTLPLGALAFFATSPTFFDKAPWGDYLKNARSAGFATVPVVDRKPLTTFLLGEYDGADHLVAASETFAAAAAILAPEGRKRKLEGGDEEMKAEEPASAAAAAPSSSLAPAPARAPSPSSPLDPLAITRSLELSLRDRNSQMLAAAAARGGTGGNKVGFSAILEQADKAAAAEKAARARRALSGSSGGGAAPVSSRSSAAARLGQISALPSRRFERDRGAAAGTAGAGGAGGTAGVGAAPAEGLAEFDELGIQLYGARAAKAAAEAEAAAAAAAAAEAAKRQQREAEAAAARQQQQRSAAPKRKADAASAAAPSSSASAGPPGVSGGLPIIVVPAAATARLNMINAPAFFSKGVFEHPDALRASGHKKSATAVIEREVARETEAGSSSSQQQGGAGRAARAGAGGGSGAGGGGASNSAPQKYFITDRTDTFRSLDWSRVVAVVVSGAAWQFKGWPFKGLKEGHTVDLFSKVAGVFVGYGDEEPPAAVKTWNVSRHLLHREARHRDRSVASAVWRAVDAMGASRRARALG